MAKAPYQNGFDGEERKLGEQTGLDSGSFCCCIGYYFVCLRNLR